jgi:Opioid growth factor receptor (OGFr) conserved region
VDRKESRVLLLIVRMSNISYIPWLFPNQERVNNQPPPLQAHEIIAMQTDGQSQTRVRRAFRRILKLYGMDITAELPTVPLRIIPYRSRVWGRYRALETNDLNLNYSHLNDIFKSLVELGEGDMVPSTILFILMLRSTGKVKHAGLDWEMAEILANCMRDLKAQACVAKAIEAVFIPAPEKRKHRFTEDMYTKLLQVRVTNHYTWPVWDPDQFLEIPPNAFTKAATASKKFISKLKR